MDTSTSSITPLRQRMVDIMWMRQLKSQCPLAGRPAAEDLALADGVGIS